MYGILYIAPLAQHIQIFHQPSSFWSHRQPADARPAHPGVLQFLSSAAVSCILKFNMAWRLEDRVAGERMVRLEVLVPWLVAEVFWHHLEFEHLELAVWP